MTSRQWEFEVRDGWEAFGPEDQRALARARSTGKKQVTLHRAPTDGSSVIYSYRLDLEKMTQVNLGSGRQRKLRRLPAGPRRGAEADSGAWVAGCDDTMKSWVLG